MQARADGTVSPAVRALPGLQRAQTEMLAHRFEVAIVVQKDVAVAEAEGRDDHVDRLAHCDAPLPQQPIVSPPPSCARPDRRPVPPGIGADCPQEGF
jgi:hypothetical protein